MTERDDQAPSSPASASALRGPSAAVTELEERAERARLEEVESAEARRLEAQRARDKEAAAREAEQRNAARAPTGFFRSMRFFWLMLSGLILVGNALVNLIDDVFVPWRFLGPIAGGWALSFLVLLLDARTWRRRVPFAIDGFDQIAGEDHSGDSDAPWIAFEVRVTLAQDGSEARDARARTVDILVSRANRMLNKDADLKPTTGQRWRLHEDGSCRGAATPEIYTTRILEKWMRGEVALLAKSFPVAKVMIRARYTGSSTRIPD